MLYSGFKFHVIQQYSTYRRLPRDHEYEATEYCFPLSVYLGIDWDLRQVTSGGRTGSRWTLTSVLEDLDYADDIALLGH